MVEDETHSHTRCHTMTLIPSSPKRLPALHLVAFLSQKTTLQIVMQLLSCIRVSRYLHHYLFLLPIIVLAFLTTHSFLEDLVQVSDLSYHNIPDSLQSFKQWLNSNTTLIIITILFVYLQRLLPIITSEDFVSYPAWHLVSSYISSNYNLEGWCHFTDGEIEAERLTA